MESSIVNIEVHGKNLTGTVPAISAKSVAHRLLICAALSNNITTIRCDYESDDILATIACLQSLGADIKRVENSYKVLPISLNTNLKNEDRKKNKDTHEQNNQDINKQETESKAQHNQDANHQNICEENKYNQDSTENKNTNTIAQLLCKESGSTLRFLLPVVASLNRASEFILEGRLAKRPLSPLYEELIKHGAVLSPMGEEKLSVIGKLTAGTYTLAGNISSQYFSGLLFALPLLDGRSEIHIKGDLASRQYINLTLEALAQFGIKIQETENSFIIEGGQKYHAPEYTEVEGDWSNAAFWLCAGALSEQGISCTHLKMDSLQGDKEIVNILENFGARVIRKENAVFVKKDTLKGITIDAEQIPDLIPIVSVLAAVAEGTTEIINAGRLRLKESDRLEAITTTLTTLGARVTQHENGLTINGLGLNGLGINGQKKLTGGTISSYGDHRIAMMAAIASTVCENKVIINDAQVVEKSYPNFYTDFMLLEGKSRRSK